VPPTPERYEVEGRAEERIALPLPIGAATGYEWTLEVSPGVERVEDSAPRPVDARSAWGATHGGSVQVTAPPGHHTITARLARRWAPDTPARVVHIDLHVT
jgi:hypothetical protein